MSFLFHISLSSILTKHTENSILDYLTNHLYTITITIIKPSCKHLHEMPYSQRTNYQPLSSNHFVGFSICSSCFPCISQRFYLPNNKKYLYIQKILPRNLCTKNEDFIISTLNKPMVVEQQFQFHIYLFLLHHGADNFHTL